MTLCNWAQSTRAQPSRLMCPSPLGPFGPLAEETGDRSLHNRCLTDKIRSVKGSSPDKVRSGRKLVSRGIDGGGWEERSSPVQATDGDGLGQMKATGGGAEERSLVGGRGSSQRCHLGRTGSVGGRRWGAYRWRGGVLVWELMGVQEPMASLGNGGAE
jgi:hypothetical protein